jgi:hypothetical protein
MARDGDASDVFELVGNPDRLSIVEVLIETRREDEDPHVRFTDLRNGSDIEDTGRFNYHLDQLLGTFVTKTEEGYRLSSYAHRIMAPMMGGVYDPERASDPIETPGECPECDSELKIEPSETVLQIRCEQGHPINRGLLGYPGVVGDRPPAEANQALGLINMHGVELAVSGTCPTCNGPVDGAFHESDDAEYYYFESPCRTCGNQFANTVGGCVLTHPAIVSFFYDHGIDVREMVPWELSFVYPGAETVESTDPLRLSVDIVHDDEVLTVTVDRNATVVSTERTGP